MKSLKLVAVTFLTTVLIVLVGIVLLRVFNKEADFFVDKSHTAVVHEIVQLNRLESAQFTIEKVIDAQTSGGAFRQFLFGDQILLIAHGEVIAGVDLSQINDSDVRIDEERLYIKLPAPEIFLVRIDNEKTQVYDRRSGILTRGNKDLESEARKEAEIEIRSAACESGILDEARTNASRDIEVLLSAFQFREVVVEIDSGNC